MPKGVVRHETLNCSASTILSGHPNCRRTLNNDEIEILGEELIHNFKKHELRLANEEDTDWLDSITGVGIGKPHDPCAEKKRLSKSLKRLTICLVPKSVMKTSFTSPMALLIEFAGGDETVMA